MAQQVFSCFASLVVLSALAVGLIFAFSYWYRTVSKSTSSDAFGAAGLLGYAFNRTAQDQKFLHNQPEDYTDADDALEAAGRLDQIGEWDKAIELYEITAERWPEHRQYVNACVDDVRKKQALGSQ